MHDIAKMAERHARLSYGQVSQPLGSRHGTTTTHDDLRASAAYGIRCKAVSRMDTDDIREILSVDYHNVFVYGTLKTGCGNNRMLRDIVWRNNPVGVHTRLESTCKGTAYTVSDNMMMGAFAGFPMLFQTDGKSSTYGGKAMGEVWRVPRETLLTLDRLEGHPHFYRRKKVKVRFTSDGEEMDVWAYFGHLSSYITEDGKKGYELMRKIIRPIPNHTGSMGDAIEWDQSKDYWGETQ